MMKVTGHKLQVIGVLITCVLCLVSCHSAAFAADGVYSEAGTSTAQFLKIPVGARYQALGGAYAAIGDDVHGLYGQPAAGSLASRQQVAGTHNEWLEDLRHEYVGFIYKTGPERAITGHFTYLGVGDIERTDEDAAGNLTTRGGSFEAADYALALGYADCWTPVIRYGGMIKYIHSEIDDVSADAWAVDAGVLYHYNNQLTLGASLTNLGGKMKFTRTADPIPLTWRLGVAYDLPIARQCNLLLTGDAVKPNDARWGGRFGAELYNGDWALRAGYRSDDALDNGFSCGAGYRFFDSFEVDYAWAPGGVLGNTQFFSATYLFR